jgi:hypothetical protein
MWFGVNILKRFTLTFLLNKLEKSLKAVKEITLSSKIQAESIKIYLNSKRLIHLQVK